MSTLAFNKEGEPFSFDPRTEQLRLRRFRKPGARGTCEVVLDADGEQVYVGADADYAEVKDVVDNVPGFYRLDQCDAEGRPIPGVPAAYVSIEPTRNAGSSSDGDAMAVIRELAAINAEVSKTMADRFAAVMQSTAEILRAADGASIAHRKPIVVSAPVPDNDEDDDEDEDVAPSQADEATATSANTIASIAAIIDAVPPLVQTLSALYTQIKASVAQGAAQTTPPAGATASGSAPAAAPPTEAAPSSGPVYSGGAAGASGPSDASATAPNATTARAEVSVGTSSPSTAGSSSTASFATSVKNPIASGPATTASSASVASGSSPNGNAVSTVQAVAQQASPNTASPNTAPRPVATQQGAAALVVAPPTAIRNAPLAPTPQQLAHLMAIYARLTPKEQAIAEQVIARMTHDLRAKWLADLSAQPVEKAVQMIRDTIANLRFAQRDRDRG